MDENELKTIVEIKSFNSPVLFATSLIHSDSDD
jgi:hypothetical protein